MNNNFPLIKALEESLSKKQKSHLNILLRMINTRVNSIRHVHEERDFVGLKEKDGFDEQELEQTIIDLISSGITIDQIKEEILPNLGFKLNSLPEEVLKILDK